jgi:hypothetical protein
MNLYTAKNAMPRCGIKKKSVTATYLSRSILSGRYKTMSEQAETIVEDKVIGGTRHEHPSYGVIEISRWQGSETALFGSSILHRNGINIRILTAGLHRTLGRDWIHGGKVIVDFNMSPTQFADAITSLNAGEANPITLEYVTGDKDNRRPQAPYKSKTKQFNDEFTMDCKELAKRFDSTIQLAKDTHAQKRLISEIEMLRQEVASNLPFVNESFTEQMEHTIKEAKGEVEAFITGMVHNYGLEAIRAQAPTIAEHGLKDLNSGDSPMVIKEV